MPKDYKNIETTHEEKKVFELHSLARKGGGPPDEAVRLMRDVSHSGGRSKLINRE